jgi:magnesium chelatase family protein
VDYDKLSSDRLEEATTVIRSRVEAVRQVQRVPFNSLDIPNPIACNADMWVADVRMFCKLDEAGESLMRAIMSQMILSARGYHRVLKLP